MNKAQKEVQQAQLDEEKKVIRLLEVVYERAKKDCEQKIRELSARTDLENLQSIVYQKEYQQIIVDQLDYMLNELQNNEFATIADYLENCYSSGICSLLYDDGTIYATGVSYSQYLSTIYFSHGTIEVTDGNVVYTPKDGTSTTNTMENVTYSWIAIGS